MKSAGKARNNGLYRHIRTSKEIIRNLLNYYFQTYYTHSSISKFNIFCNYSEPCKIAFCECLHSDRIAILYGEVTPFAK